MSQPLSPRPGTVGLHRVAGQCIANRSWGRDAGHGISEGSRWLLLVCVACVGCASPGRGLDSLLRHDARGGLVNGEDYSSRLARAQQSLDNGKLDEARAIYEKLVVEFPDRSEPLHMLARTADRQRRHREAQALYAEAIRLRPQPELFSDLGYSYYLDGQLLKAESALVKATAAAPSNARFRNNLALTYGALGKLDLALEEFRKAGSEADAQYNLAFVLATHDDIDGAKRAFELALTADPTYERARTALRGFHEFERLPPELRQQPELAQNQGTWVPFVEGAPDGGASAAGPSVLSGGLAAAGAAPISAGLAGSGAGAQAALNLPGGAASQ